MDELTRKRLKNRYKSDIAILKQNQSMKDVTEEDLDGGMALKAACDDIINLYDRYVSTVGENSSSVASFCVALGIIINSVMETQKEKERVLTKRAVRNAINGKPFNELFK